MDHTHQHSTPPSNPASGFKAYYPLLLILLYITGVTLLNQLHAPQMQWQSWMHQWMAGFFLVFSAFKFLDLRGFVEGYATYDLLAQRFSVYGWLYPFLELALGILYLTQWFPHFTNYFTILLMGFSSLGVINSLRKKQKLHCACLGTLLNVPLSTVTLLEDLIMIILAAISLAF